MRWHAKNDMVEEKNEAAQAARRNTDSGAGHTHALAQIV